VNDGGKERTKLDIDESQSQVVISIFEEVIKGKGLTEIVKQLNSKGNIVYISGIADQPGNILRDDTAKNVLTNYPDIKVLAQANGNWDQAASQQVMTDLLGSFPQIDGVLTQDGMALGVIRAFQAAGRPLPVVTGETQVAFIKMWKQLKDSQGFSTLLPREPNMAISRTGL